jgi:hypothetical protein
MSDIMVEHVEAPKPSTARHLTKLSVCQRPSGNFGLGPAVAKAVAANAKNKTVR